jgi:hypothetical protein
MPQQATVIRKGQTGGGSTPQFVSVNVRRITLPAPAKRRVMDTSYSTNIPGSVAVNCRGNPKACKGLQTTEAGLIMPIPWSKVAEAQAGIGALFAGLSSYWAVVA